MRLLLPVLRVVAQSNSLHEKVLAELHELINDVERLPAQKVGGARLKQLEEELAVTFSAHSKMTQLEENLLWAELQALLCDFPRLSTSFVPEESKAAYCARMRGTGAEAEAGAATGALKELLQQRPPSVSDDELQFLLRQSPEECLRAHLGIAEAAEHEANAGERARLVFLARAASIVVADACRLHRARDLERLTGTDWFSVGLDN